MHEVIVAINRNLQKTKEELEQVKKEIEQYKAERGPEVFATWPEMDSLLWDRVDRTGDCWNCLCRDPDVKPWTRCPVHDSPVD